MSKSVPALRLVDRPPAWPSNVVRLPVPARDQNPGDIVRLSVRHEVTTIEIERRLQR